MSDFNDILNSLVENGSKPCVAAISTGFRRWSGSLDGMFGAKGRLGGAKLVAGAEIRGDSWFGGDAKVTQG